MAITVTGIPETIDREDYLRLIRSVGIDPDLCMELTFGVNGITATVIVTDEDGRAVADRSAVATHQVYIRVAEKREWKAAHNALGSGD